MDNGFGRGRIGTLVWALIVAVMVPAAARAGRGSGGAPQLPRAGRSWWDVSLNVSVKGEYSIRGAEAPVTGTYVYRARWRGRLELDNDGDFLLVHFGTEVVQWSLKERSVKDGRESVLEAAPGRGPSLRMEYLIKDGAEVEVVFGLGQVGIPMRDLGLKAALELPRSSARRPGPPGRGYGDFVCRGSCRVAIPAEDLITPAPERRFAWDWRREKERVLDGKTIVDAQSHTAEVVVSVIIH